MGQALWIVQSADAGRRASGEGAHFLSTAIAGSRLTGVSGPRQLESRQSPVTMTTLPPSIPYSRAKRDTTPLAGWTGQVLGLGTGRERERGSPRYARNILETCEEHACNILATLELLRCCSSGTLAPPSRSFSRKAALLRRQSSASRGGAGKTPPR